jgi:hypothetical protein
MQIDKENNQVIYNDASHVYLDKEDGVQYISVTTLIGKYHQHFDSDYWSSYKALERLVVPSKFKPLKSTLFNSVIDEKFIQDLGVDFAMFSIEKEAILKEWEDNKNKACERGTAIHSIQEHKSYEDPHCFVKLFNLGGTFKCKEKYYELDYEKGVYPEYLISAKTQDGILRIAGQIDLMIKDGNDIIITDFKTNKKLSDKSHFDPKTKSYAMMKYPLNHLMDCNLNHYALQLSLYAWLLQKQRPEFNIKKLMIIHFDHDGGEHHIEVPYLNKEVEAMLKHYKKELKLQEWKNKRKPINYE